MGMASADKITGGSAWRGRARRRATTRGRPYHTNTGATATSEGGRPFFVDTAALPASPGHEVSGLRDGTGSTRFDDWPPPFQPVSTGGGFVARTLHVRAGPGRHRGTA